MLNLLHGADRQPPSPPQSVGLSNGWSRPTAGSGRSINLATTAAAIGAILSLLFLSHPDTLRYTCFCELLQIGYDRFQPLQIPQSRAGLCARAPHTCFCGWLRSRTIKTPPIRRPNLDGDPLRMPHHRTTTPTRYFRTLPVTCDLLA